jgi:hypothetical protein
MVLLRLGHSPGVLPLKSSLACSPWSPGLLFSLPMKVENWPTGLLLKADCSALTTGFGEFTWKYQYNTVSQAWWRTPLIPALGRQRQVDFWVRGQPGLQSEFQDSQGYTEKPCLEKKKKKEKRKNTILSVSKQEGREVSFQAWLSPTRQSLKFFLDMFFFSVLS